MPMKVAVIDPSLFTLPYDSVLCGALARRDCTVTLYGRAPRLNEIPTDCFPFETFFYRFSERLRAATGVDGFSLKLVKGVEHYHDMARLCGVLEQAKPDVIHFQWTPLPAIDKFTIKSFREIAPLVLTVHDITPFNNSPGSNLQKVGAVKILFEFDRLIVHSESSRDTLIARGISPDRIVTIPHGLLSVPNSSAERMVNPAQTTILLFGNLKPYKGADVLIEAFGMLPANLRRQGRLLIVGQPHFDIAPLKKRAIDLGIAERTNWDLRYLSNAELATTMGKADIFVFPYRDIDTSGVLMSCFPYGKPVVASNIGAFKTLVKGGVHGHLVPPGDPGTLSTALADLIRNPDVRERYGNAVREIAGTIPTWDQIAERTVTLYKELQF